MVITVLPSLEAVVAGLSHKSSGRVPQEHPVSQMRRTGEISPDVYRAATSDWHFYSWQVVLLNDLSFLRFQWQV